MGLLPFDDWIYHLPHLRDEVNKRHSECMTLEATVQSDLLTFNAQLDKYKTIVASNALLLIMKQTVMMDDFKLSEYTTVIDALPPPVTGSVPLNFAVGVVELIGGVLVLKALVNVGKLAKNAIFNSVRGTKEVVCETVAETMTDAGVVPVTEAATTASLRTTVQETGEAVTEEVIVSSTSASLAATGVGIVFAVGLDVIFASINGAKERDEIQEQLNKFDAALNKIRTFQNTIREKSTKLKADAVTQFDVFKNLAKQCLDILPSEVAFKYDYPSDISQEDNFIAAMNTAINEFGVLAQLKHTYLSMKARFGDKLTASNVQFVALQTMPPWTTDKMISELWAILAKYSDEILNLKP